MGLERLDVIALIPVPCNRATIDVSAVVENPVLHAGLDVRILNVQVRGQLAHPNHEVSIGQLIDLEPVAATLVLSPLQELPFNKSGLVGPIILIQPHNVLAQHNSIRVAEFSTEP